jgi:predicted RNA binding protein YcfA (HicA-like mRNA interferase family)
VAAAVGKLATNVQEEDYPKAADAQSARNKKLDTRTVVRALKKAGFEVHRRAGAHYILRDDSDPPHTVVLPRQASSITGGLLRQILRAAELSETEFETLLGGP